MYKILKGAKLFKKNGLKWFWENFYDNYYKLQFIIIIIIIIVSIITVFAGVLFVHQPRANHAPRASVTQVNHSVHTLSTFLRIRADPSMQIF